MPCERWRIEPYPLTGERRNTLLVLGETGVFVISTTYAPGHWDDVVTVHKLAGKIQLLLPGYGGAVQAAICHPFTSAPPRLWHRPDDQGNWIAAWVLGGDHVVDWLEHFGGEHGLSRRDLERFERLAKPNWLKAAIPSPPSWPPMPDTTPPGTAGWLAGQRSTANPSTPRPAEPPHTTQSEEPATSAPAAFGHRARLGPRSSPTH